MRQYDIHHAPAPDLAARMAGAPAGQEKGAITILLHDRRVATVEVGPLRGSPENRLNAEQLMMKFADRARHAVRPPSDDAAHAAIHTIRHLDEPPNVDEPPRHFI